MDNIQMIGYDAVHSSDFIYEGEGNRGYYLLILTNTAMKFWQDGEWKIYPPRQAVLFAPDSKMKYGACEDSFGNDWMIFQSDELYVTQFPLVAVPFPVKDPEYCHCLFQLLTWEHTQDRYGTVISQLLSVLFQKLGAGIRQPDNDDYAYDLLVLRRKIMNSPKRAWNVSEMAGELHISAGYLQQLYKQQFGISCMEDVIQSRMRLAKDYLTHTHLRVSEIAWMCGYHSVEHFSRQFRSFNGMAPGLFREKQGSASSSMNHTGSDSTEH